MDEEDRKEIRAMVVGYLQQTMKEHPRGLSLQEFERRFPEAADEPRDWYKRYGKKHTLEALQCIEADIKLRYDSHTGTNFISLNLNSEAVDEHLVDLITNQRSSNKKRSRGPHAYTRPSHRVLASRSFSLNRQYSSDHFYRSSNQPARLNHDQQYRGDQLIRRRSPPPTSFSVPRPPSIYDKSPKWMTPNDPRQRSSPIVSNVQPQVQTRPPEVQASPTPARPVVSQPNLPAAPSSESSSSKSLSADRLTVTAPVTSVEECPPDDEPEMARKKDQLRQRLVSLLLRKCNEIKIFHLNGLYQMEFNEPIDHAAYNHKNLATLLQDPIIKESIQINHKTPFATISFRRKIQSSEKENTIHSNEINGNNISTAKSKLNAIDPFNVRPMLNCLEPLGNINELPMSNLEIDYLVKYKTFRMVFQSEENKLLLDDWEVKFEQKHRLRIRIRDYGCRTVLDFFKRLSIDIPIKVELQEDQWVAIADLERVSSWLRDKMQNKQYRALTAIDERYELIAFPDDAYTYTDIKDIILPSYQPAHILSVKRADSMWIQLRTPRRIEDQLCVETSLTCYQDFRELNLLPAPRPFIKPGFPCAVFDKNMERWCRGLVLKEENRGGNIEVNLLLVDYGLERIYGITQLMCLMKTHLKLPVGSIYSKLHGIRDDKANSIKVQRNAKMILQEYTNPPVTLACKFVGSLPALKAQSHLPDRCAEVILVDTRQGNDCNLADDIQNCDSHDNDDVCDTSSLMDPTVNYMST